jgi:predicted MFS family arabinose efflux permease
MWVSKPLYEALPYYDVAIGLIALIAGLYVDYWYWPAICTVVGVGSLFAGALVWRKRRDFRTRSAR